MGELYNDMTFSNAATNDGYKHSDDKSKFNLVLGEKLSKEGIVSHYSYELDASRLILELNHKYENKAIVSDFELKEWTNSVNELKDKLDKYDIAAVHATLITDTLAANYQEIADYVKGYSRNKNRKTRGRNRGSDSHEEGEEKKPECMTFKYSNEGKGDLCESVMLVGKPAFLKYDSKTDKIVAIDKIIDEGLSYHRPERIILPMLHTSSRISKRLTTI